MGLVDKLISGVQRLLPEGLLTVGLLVVAAVLIYVALTGTGRTKAASIVKLAL